MQAWPAVVAQAFGADHSNISYSGIGAVFNAPELHAKAKPLDPPAHPQAHKTPGSRPAGGFISGHPKWPEFQTGGAPSAPLPVAQCFEGRFPGPHLLLFCLL